MKILLPLFILIFVVIGCVPPPDSEKQERIDNTPKLKLLSAQGTKSEYFVEVVGEVQNISNDKIQSVWAVVSHYDKNGNLITTDESAIDFRPLMPNQRSTFKCLTQINPLMVTYKISFRDGLAGSEIKYDDARQKSDLPKKKK